MSTFGQIRYVNPAMHNPEPASVIPHPFMKNTEEMSFSQRFENILTSLVEDVMVYIYQFPLQVSISMHRFLTVQNILLHSTFRKNSTRNISRRNNLFMKL